MTPFDLERDLLSHACASAADASPPDWDRARAALEPTRADEPELAAAVDARDEAALRAIVDGWRAGKRLLPVQDRTVLKRALKAFRKRMKLTRLVDESSIGGGPMSSGRASNVVAITPPERYPREVWDELVRQKKLADARHGMYELLE